MEPEPVRKFVKFNRRRFILGTLLAAPLLAGAEARWLEPDWIKLRRISLTANKPRHRFVHFTDLHHKGDRTLLFSVVEKINALSPEFVCFTGDIVEESSFLAEALEMFARIKSPVYGVPGNHDYWSKIAFQEVEKCLAGLGGGWLLDQTMVTRDGKFSLIGASCLKEAQALPKPNPGTCNVFLMHYPAWVKNLTATRFDLMLAGHSHGGQVRLPFYGPVFVPFGVDQYDMGMFQTTSGPLYVNPGIGWFPWPIRFNCRPEITVFEI